MPPKNKSTKNQTNLATRPKRSCGAPARFGANGEVQPGPSGNAGTPVPLPQGDPNQFVVAPSSSDDDDDGTRTSGSVLSTSTPNQILEGIQTLTQLTQNQNIEIEKARRASEKSTADFEKLQRRLNKLERERAHQTANAAGIPGNSGTPNAIQRHSKKQVAHVHDSETTSDDGDDPEILAEKPKKSQVKASKKPAGRPGSAQTIQKRSNKQANFSHNRELISDDDLGTLDKSKRAKVKPTQKSAKKQNKKSKKHKNSSESSTEEGEYTSESEESDDESDDDKATPEHNVHSLFGHKVGDTVSHKLVKKIKARKFIEFSELLPQFDRYREEEMMIKMKGSRTSFVKRNNFRDLAWPQWARACDIFISLFVKHSPVGSAPDLVSELMTYKKNIELLMRRGYNFAAYDRHFRKGQEMFPSPWNQIRQDLLLDYQGSYNSEQHNSESSQEFESFGGYNGKGDSRDQKQKKTFNTTTEGVQIRLGLCVFFHSMKKRCTHENCRYEHKCPRCDADHPVFRCTKPHNGSLGQEAY